MTLLADFSPFTRPGPFEVPDFATFNGAGWIGLYCVGGPIGTELFLGMQSGAAGRDGSGRGAESRIPEKEADEVAGDGAIEYCMYSVEPGNMGTQRVPLCLFE